MGYCASGTGSIVLKKGLNALPDDAMKALMDYFEVACEGWPDKDGDTVIDFWDSEKYWEDSALTALDAVIPYIQEGLIEYNGEDDFHWRFVFDPETENWQEEEARVVWESEEPWAAPSDPYHIVITRGADEYNVSRDMFADHPDHGTLVANCYFKTKEELEKIIAIYDGCFFQILSTDNTRRIAYGDIKHNLMDLFGNE